MVQISSKLSYFPPQTEVNSNRLLAFAAPPTTHPLNYSFRQSLTCALILRIGGEAICFRELIEVSPLAWRHHNREIFWKINPRNQAT
jgi:hypothetical protein